MPVYRKLYEGTKKISPGSIRHVTSLDRCKVEDVQYMDSIKQITFIGTVYSKHSKQYYNCIVSFDSIERNEGLSNTELEKGLLPKPTLARDPIQVYCSCKSYRFRADFANRRRHAGTGPHFPPYHRISDRAPYNPRNIACFCKHIIEFVDYLKKQGFVH